MISESFKKSALETVIENAAEFGIDVEFKAFGIEYDNDGNAIPDHYCIEDGDGDYAADDRDALSPDETLLALTIFTQRASSAISAVITDAVSLVLADRKEGSSKIKHKFLQEAENAMNELFHRTYVEVKAEIEAEGAVQ